MSIEVDQAAPQTDAATPSKQSAGAPGTGGNDALDQPVPPPKAPRRAGGGTRLPVILPKSRPVEQSPATGQKTSSTARPSGSAVLESGGLESGSLEAAEMSEPPKASELDRPAFRPVPIKSESPDPARGQAGDDPEPHANSANPVAAAPTKAIVDQDEPPAAGAPSGVNESGELSAKPPPSEDSETMRSAEALATESRSSTEQSAPESAPELVSFAPSAKRLNLDEPPKPVQLGPSSDIWAGALNAAALEPTGTEADFKALVVDGINAGQGEGPRFVGAKESGTTLVGGRRRAGGKPMVAPAEPAVVGGAPVPVGGGAGPVTVPAPKAPRPPRTAGPGQAAGPQAGVPRRVKLQVARISPWSLTKMSFLLSVALGIAFVVMTFVVWNVANNAHLFTNINDKIAELAGPGNATKFNILNYVAQGKVMAGATVIAVVNTVLATVLATLGALIYNITAVLVGGVHVIMRDD